MIYYIIIALAALVVLGMLFASMIVDIYNKIDDEERGDNYWVNDPKDK